MGAAHHTPAYTRLALNLSGPAAERLPRDEVLRIIRDEITEPYISPEMAGWVLSLGGTSVRLQAQEDLETGTNMLGFKCTKAGHAIRIHRKSFLEAVG